MLSSALRKELSALSKEVFGSSSRYVKMMEGMPELVQEEVTEYVPGKTDEDDGTTRKVNVPVTYKGTSTKTYAIKRYTAEEIHVHMLSLKAKRDAMIEEWRKMQAAEAAKKALEEQVRKVQETIGGSAGLG